jgi:hypothetical protein
LRYEHILNVAFRKILLLQQLWKWNYFHRYVFVFMWLLTVTVIRLFLSWTKKVITIFFKMSIIFLNSFILLH